MQKKEIKKIIVRMPNWLGDAVMASPILTDLKQTYNDAELHIMALPPVAALFSNDPLFKIFPFSREEPAKTLVKRLKNEKFDLGVLLPNSFSSAWWFWRGGVKQRLGFAANGRSPFLTTALPFPPERGKEHLVWTYKRLLLPLGIPLSNTDPSLLTIDREKTLAHFSIPPHVTLVGINPGAAYGSAKCWLPDRFRKVTELLLENYPELHILYFGDKTGTPLVNTICEGLPPRVINLASKTSLPQLISLISSCKVLLTNDSGPMHIAAACRTPLVALFGSTNETVTGPFPQGSVIHKHVSCSPCYKRTCPIDFRCMKSITVEEVFEEISKKLL